uniref:Tyr recombinase domain-containing protein n=1 Tax=Amphimedon queenslandica TaxID=400682 RepID=A0A1X7SQE5_AMPQE
MAALEDDSGYTNHCLRATSVSRMYNAGIPERMISEKSGHKSIEGLRAYERTSDELERMAERSIAGEPSGALCEVKKVKKEPEEHFPHPNFSAMSNCTINITYNK